MGTASGGRGEEGSGTCPLHPQNEPSGPPCCGAHPSEAGGSAYPVPRPGAASSLEQPLGPMLFPGTRMFSSKAKSSLQIRPWGIRGFFFFFKPSYFFPSRG